MEEKQETKKTIKISLKTAIFVGILIVVMILAIIGLVTYIFIKDNKAENINTNIVKKNKAENTNINIVKENKENEEVEKIEENSYAYKYFNEGLEVETLLPKNQALKITSIEKNNEGKFVITGNVYEECIISKEELEDLKKGKTINLYGREYKYEYKKGIKEKNEVLDRDYEYEIEQLIPIDGSEGVYLINVFINTMGEGRRVIAKNNLEGVRLIYAHVEDLVERIGAPVFNYQEIINIDADTLLFEKKPVETKTITVNNIKGYGTYSSYYNEFYAQADDLEKIYNDCKEYGADYYYLNFIMKNGEEIEFWYNIG